MSVAIAVIVGLGIGIIVWMFSSHWVAVLLNRVEDRNPALIGSRVFRIYEAVICGFVFIACLALAAWLSLMIWLQVK
jgi:hypothetical protein